MAEDSHDYGLLCNAVGALMLEFASLEVGVSAGLRLHLTFRLEKHPRAESLNLAGAIYGSMRLRTSQNIMRRIIVEEGAPPRTLEIFDALFAHVGHINTLRDKLAHQAIGIEPTKPGVWTVSDLVTTRDVRNNLVYQFTANLIWSAVADLKTANKLQRACLANPAFIDREPDELPTWRYKPSELKLVRRKSAPFVPARTPPP